MAEKKGGGGAHKHVCNVAPCCTRRFPELSEAVGPFYTKNPTPEEHAAQLRAFGVNAKIAKDNARKLRGTDDGAALVTHGAVGFKSKAK